MGSSPPSPRRQGDLLVAAVSRWREFSLKELLAVEIRSSSSSREMDRELNREIARRWAEQDSGVESRPSNHLGEALSCVEESLRFSCAVKAEHAPTADEVRKLRQAVRALIAHLEESS